MPGRTGNFLALKMNQKSGSTGLSLLKIKLGEFAIFLLSTPHPHFMLNHSQCNRESVFHKLYARVELLSLENSVIKLKLKKLQI